MATLCHALNRSSVMTTARIALIEPWPGRRMGGHGFRISSFLVVLADDAAGRVLPIWLNGPEGHNLFRGDGDHPHPEPAEVITARLLSAAGVTVTGVDIDELDAELTTGPQDGRDLARAVTRIEFTAAGTAGTGSCRSASGTRWPWPPRPARRSGCPASYWTSSRSPPTVTSRASSSGTCRFPGGVAAGRAGSAGTRRFAWPPGCPGSAGHVVIGRRPPRASTRLGVRPGTGRAGPRPRSTPVRSTCARPPGCRPVR